MFGSARTLLVLHYTDCSDSEECRVLAPSDDKGHIAMNYILGKQNKKKKWPEGGRSRLSLS